MDHAYLWNKLNITIQSALKNKLIREIIVNEDSKIWLVQQDNEMTLAGEMPQSDALAFVNALAQHTGQFINAEKPYLDAILPFAGERINITIPPFTAGVSFNIRKKSTKRFTLKDYIANGAMSELQALALTQAICQRKNILVSGGPGSGKTTLTNTLLDVIAAHSPKGHRVILIEYEHELDCRIENLKAMHCGQHASMQTALWIAMRALPMRIVIGEVRDGSALELLKAWNTGCPGGIATIHANSVQGCVQRLLDLSQEVTSLPPYNLVSEAVDIIVQIEADKNVPAGRRITDIAKLKSYDKTNHTFSFESLAGDNHAKKDTQIAA